MPGLYLPNGLHKPHKQLPAHAVFVHFPVLFGNAPESARRTANHKVVTGVFAKISIQHVAALCYIRIVVTAYCLGVLIYFV
jgi:hypothetical protein